MKNKNRIAFLFSLALLFCVHQTQAMLTVQKPSGMFAQVYNYALEKIQNMFSSTPSRTFSTGTTSYTPLFQKNESLEKQNAVKKIDQNQDTFLQKYITKKRNPLTIEMVEDEFKRKLNSIPDLDGPYGSKDTDEIREFKNPQDAVRYRNFLIKGWWSLNKDASRDYDFLRKEGVSPILRTYLESGGDPNAIVQDRRNLFDRRLLLIKEAYDGNIGNVRLLLQYGAIPDLQFNEENAVTATLKFIPTCSTGFVIGKKIIDLLFSYGFNANNIMGDNNPLRYVIDHKIPNAEFMIEKFIKNGTDPDALGITEVLEEKVRRVTEFPLGKGNFTPEEEKFLTDFALKASDMLALLTKYRKEYLNENNKQNKE